MSKCQCGACDCSGKTAAGQEVCHECGDGAHHGRVRYSFKAQKPPTAIALKVDVPICRDCLTAMKYLEKAQYGRFKGNPVWWCRNCKATRPATQRLITAE